jgi:hypothetical protein
VGSGGHTGQLVPGRIGAPRCNIYIINTVVVLTTRHMDHESVDIYIDTHAHARSHEPLGAAWAPKGPGAGARRGAHPRRPAPRTYHVTLRLFKRLSTQNVTQLFEKVAHFVW